MTYSGYRRAPLWCLGLCAVLLAASTGGLSLSAGSLDGVVGEAARGVQEGALSQQRIADLDDEARALFERYRVVIRNVTALEAYVERLRQLADDQKDSIDRYQKDLQEVEAFERRLLPAMDRMTGVLGQSVHADLPFLPSERKNRLLRLRGLMQRSDVSTSEKFRQLMEAYQVESDYGRTIGTYRGSLDGDTGQVVNFLRVGRSLLAYQTLDGRESGMWDAAAGRWRSLEAGYRDDIRRALRIAAKQSVPDLLTLPFAAPVNLEDLR